MSTTSFSSRQEHTRTGAERAMQVALAYIDTAGSPRAYASNRSGSHGALGPQQQIFSADWCTTSFRMSLCCLWNEHWFGLSLATGLLVLVLLFSYWADSDTIPALDVPLLPGDKAAASDIVPCAWRDCFACLQLRAKTTLRQNTTMSAPRCLLARSHVTTRPPCRCWASCLPCPRSRSAQQSMLDAACLLAPP